METMDLYAGLSLSEFVSANKIHNFKDIISDNISRLERKLNTMHGDGNYAPILVVLKEANPNSYRHLKKMIGIAYRKILRENRYRY
jgi:hypothetical protein